MPFLKAVIDMIDFDRTSKITFAATFIICAWVSCAVFFGAKIIEKLPFFSTGLLAVLSIFIFLGFLFLIGWSVFFVFGRIGQLKALAFVPVIAIAFTSYFAFFAFSAAAIGD